MRIERLRLKNYRGFEEFNIEFNKYFNVLIGDNASGKTTILDALALSISSYFLGIDSHYSKSITDKDIRIDIFSENLEPQLPVEIEAEGVIENTRLIWMRNRATLKGTTRKSLATSELQNIANYHQEKVRNNVEVQLPIFSYYGTGRLWKEKKTNLKTRPKSSRFEGYDFATEPESNSKNFLLKMKTWELGVLQKSIDPTPLTVIKASVGLFLKQNQRIFYDVINDTIMLESIEFEKKSKTSHTPWTSLSDGYRNIIAMAADLAYKCVVLNPHLGIQATEKAEGIVLIDEIDLHLHPKWQRTIVESFKKAFPKMQFITTTHSPFIVQSLKNEELQDLQGKDYDSDYLSKGIEEISENEMGIKNLKTSVGYSTMVDKAESYYNLLDQLKDLKGTELDLANMKLDSIENEYQSYNPAYSALLKSERKAKK